MNGCHANPQATDRPFRATAVGCVRHLHEHLHGCAAIPCGAGANSMRPVTMATDPNGGLSWAQAEGGVSMVRAGEPTAA